MELKRVDLTEHRDSNVAVFTHWNEKYDDLAKIAMPNFAEYCNKHQYFLRGYTNYHEDPEQPETYGDKMKFQYYVDLRGHFDIVMFLDVDALFMNHAITVEDKIGPGNFCYTYDHNGPCSGLWIARTNDKTERHLRYAYEYAATNNNVRHGKVEPNGISDQDAFTRLMNVPPFDETFGIDHCWEAMEFGHTYQDTYWDGAWVVTFPGCSLEEKIELMKGYRERV